MNDLPLDSQEPMEFSYELKIPKERIAVLVGTKGTIKEELEAQSECVIHVDSKEGDVKITGTDSVKLYMLKDVVKAISRGFNPEIAMRLFKADYVFELLDLSEHVKNKDQMPRIKGRVIGKGGKARERIEEFTETNIVVYGKTIGIIGQVETVPTALRAIESLVEGSPHTSVFKWLEKHRKATEFERLSGF